MTEPRTPAEILADAFTSATYGCSYESPEDDLVCIDGSYYAEAVLAALTPAIAAKALRDMEKHILGEQVKNAEQPEETKVHHGDAARAWSNGMSNARRLLRTEADRIEAQS